MDALRGEKGAKLAAETMGSGATSLGDALWCCANLYSDIKLRLSHKRLMIFTCRDEPHEGNSTKDKQARTKASDLKETGGSEAATVKFITLNVLTLQLCLVNFNQPFRLLSVLSLQLTPLFYSFRCCY